MEPFVREAASVNVASSLRELREARGISMRTLATKKRTLRKCTEHDRAWENLAFGQYFI